FDTWVNGASVPHFKLRNVKLTAAAGKISATGTIDESNAAKDLVTAVPIYAMDAQGQTRFLAFVFADDVKTDFKLTAPPGTMQLLLDPQNTVLRR
ncbi:MAG: hypothetical protein ACRD4F_05310, partial [Candidatus Angelobacter sp.]